MESRSTRFKERHLATCFNGLTYGKHFTRLTFPCEPSGKATLLETGVNTVQQILQK